MAIGIPQTSTQRIEKAHEPSAAARSGREGRFSIHLGRFVNPKELLFFSSQMSLMLEIGTPINRALRAIANQTENERFRQALLDIMHDVEAGRQLSEAMKQHPRVFDKVYSSMIKAGETVGLLKEILDRLVEMEEKRQVLKTQIKSALTYPMVLCGMATLVIVFVLVGVLPKFTSFFAGKESVLPMTTRVLMDLSHSLKAYWWLYIAGTLGSVFGMTFFFKSEPGAVLVDRVMVGAPLIGRFSNKIFNCQLLRILGNLMESHVPLLEALEVTRGTVSNRYYTAFIDRIINHVREGGRFSGPFADYPYTLESVKQMVATGEEGGNLPRVMLRLAKFYDEEVDRELKGVAALIEPIALVFLGGIIGLIVSSVILPMFKLAQVVH